MSAEARADQRYGAATEVMTPFSGKEAYEKHAEELRRVPDLDTVLRKHFAEQGRACPDNVNMGLKAVEDFRKTVKQTQVLRKVIRNIGNAPEIDEEKASEMVRAVKLLGEKKNDIDEYLAFGLPFEKTYRAYLRSKGEYNGFKKDMIRRTELEKRLYGPAFRNTGTDLDPQDYSLLEEMSRDDKASEREDFSSEIDILEQVCPKGSVGYLESLKIIKNASSKEKAFPKSKKALKEEIEALNERINDRWDDENVRYFWKEAERKKMMTDLGNGKSVIETQSVIHNLNTLDEWEHLHHNTTIGGVLVGPPGTGKTTLVRHYLEAKNRDFVYIDLSEDVTRYMLYGSKAVELKSPVDEQSDLISNLSKMNNHEFEAFFKNNSKILQSVFRLKNEEAEAVELGQLEELLDKGGVSNDAVNNVREKVEGLAQTAYHKELGKQYLNLIKKNGWRDGVIIAALRRGDSVIFDEFNKNKNWSLIYSLMTAKTGDKWYFADNDETINIPEDWKMYFTANVGRKHGVFEVPEAFASRAAGKVLELDYPPTAEEFELAFLTLSDANGNFLRDEEDVVNLHITINDLFPKIRTFIKDKRQAIPLSYRTIRDLGEKLVMTRDPLTSKPIYQRTDKTFDEALFEVLIESNKVYEDEDIRKALVDTATICGLLLGPEVENQVKPLITGGDETYNSRLESKKDHQKSFEDIKNEIIGKMSETPSADINPEQNKI